MKKAVSAGGVIVQDGKILFVKLSHIGNITFPKGHVEAGETYETAALREVTEETGFKDLQIIKKLGVATRPSTERNGDKVIKDIHLFLMRITGKSRAKPDEETEWLTFEEALTKLLPQEVEFLKSIRNNLD